MVKSMKTRRKTVSFALLLTETTLAIIIFIGMYASFDNYYQVRNMKRSGYAYLYAGTVSINTRQHDLTTEYSSETIIEYRKYTKTLLDDFSSVDGNLSCEIGGNVAGGASRICKIYIAQNENLPIIIERDMSDNGVYVGNGLLEYVSDDMINVFGSNIPVAGIIAARGLEKNTDIYVKYGDLSENARAYVADYITMQLLENKACYFEYGSNSAGDMIQFCNNINSDVYECTYENSLPESENTSGSGITSGIKNTVYVLTACICFGVVFRTMLLYVSEKYRLIFISQSFGMSNIKIIFPIIMEYVTAWIISVIYAGIIGALLYYLSGTFYIGVILKYWAVSSIACLVLGLVFLIIAYSVITHKRQSLAFNIADSEG